jgi:hypothetical protein
MDHDSVFYESSGGMEINLNPLDFGKGMASMVGNVATTSKTTREYLLEYKSAAANKKERLIALGVEEKESALDIGDLGGNLMGGLSAMA